jgi:hypothetical protein
LCHHDNKSCPRCVQYASACGISILGVLFPDEARGIDRNFSDTRPFVQYRFCLSFPHPQPAVNAGVILCDGGDFSGTTGVHTLWGSKF